MAIRIHSSVKTPTPSAPSPLSSHNNTPQQVPSCWRSRCVASMACMIMASTVGFPADEKGIFAQEVRAVAEAQAKVGRWSDQRMCPQWRVNSLESIVPENLPRPSFRRRYESVAVDRTAPAIAALATNIGSCFSM